MQGLRPIIALATRLFAPNRPKGALIFNGLALFRRKPVPAPRAFRPLLALAGYALMALQMGDMT